MSIFDISEEKLSKEFIEILLENKNVRIKKIVSKGHTTDWYNQLEDEWVCLLEGEADLEFENGIITLYKGDSIFIPRHQRHRVLRTTQCIWLCVFIT